jgi:hypothetical protein
MAQKKSFKADLTNPAMQFISTPAEEREVDTTTVTAPAPEGYKVNPLYIETKSKRLQLLVQPSLLDKLKGRAKAEGRSVNDLVHSILEEALREEN